MTDEATTVRPEEPEWVHEMRAKGYIVRVGTDPRPLPYMPEVSYQDCEEPSVRARRGMVEFVQDLWCHARSLTRRIVHR